MHPSSFTKNTGNFIQKIFIVFVLLLSAEVAVAQTANLTGRVISTSSKEVLPGATVSIPSRQLTASVDGNGYYKFNDLKPGQVEVVFSMTSFESKSYSLDITPGQVLELHAEMDLKESKMDQVVVSARRRTNSVNSVIAEIKNTKAVVSGISRQQIASSQDNNAAQVMQRVPGVTIVDNKFVMVRGLSERYNNVMINDVIAPSTEVDKRTFSFDMIPSGSIDRIMLYKSGAPENPGDFAGAVIKLYTNSEVTTNFFEINFSSGLRSGTSFKPYFQSRGSQTDVLGFDNGYRALPLNFPATVTMQGSSRTSQLRQGAGRLLENNWDVTQSSALPDMKAGFSFGRKFRIGKLNATNITTAELSQNFISYSRDFVRYFEWDATRPDELDQRFKYTDQVYEKNNRLSVMSNFNFVFNPRHSIKFSNLFNQIGENETNIREGEDFIQTLGWRRHYMLGYRSRSIYSGQLEGKHELTSRNSLNWLIGGSWLREMEPDLRRFRTYAPGGQGASKDQFIMITPPSSNLFDASRYYGDLFEFSVNNGINFTHKLGNNAQRKEIKVGYYADYRYRDFSSRYMSFLIPGSVGSDRKAYLESQPVSTIFSQPNISRSNGFVIEEGTRPQDSYTASNLLNAGYASMLFPAGNFNITGGARVEYNIQKLNSFRNLEAVEVDNPILSVLPFLNLVYQFTEKSQFRVGYGRTVNRPEFREIAPFNFYDFKLDANRVGETGLKTASINNIDLRYELYPRLGESISIGAFYKYFNDPIENRSVITTELPTYTYINADYAYNYGAELELRKSLDQVFRSGLLSKMSINLNATYVYSVVDLGEQASAQQRVRPLQGQSPYIVNAALGYNDLASKLLISAGYNVFGKRLFAVGDLNNPDIWEMPRHSLDITATKTVRNVTIKAGIQDLLNYRFNFVQDINRNGDLKDPIDRTVFGFRRGTLVNLSFSVKL